jgi:hypothetical protein
MRGGWSAERLRLQLPLSYQISEPNWECLQVAAGKAKKVAKPKAAKGAKGGKKRKAEPDFSAKEAAGNAAAARAAVSKENTGPSFQSAASYLNTNAAPDFDGHRRMNKFFKRWLQQAMQFRAVEIVVSDAWKKIPTGLERRQSVVPWKNPNGCKL